MAGRSMPASSHDHVRITTKLQNDHHWEWPEVRLNRNPTHGDTRKRPPQDRWDGERCRAGWAHTHLRPPKPERGVSEEHGAPAPQWDPQPKFPLQKESPPQPLAVETSRDDGGRHGGRGSHSVLLKGPHGLIGDGLICSELWRWGSCSGSGGDTRGTDLSGSRARPGGAALSRKC